MRFTCEKALLSSAIATVSRTVAPKSAIVALEGILVRAGMKLNLSGYNLETGVTATVEADITSTGECVMPARLFFDIVRKLPDDTVTVHVDEKFRVTITCGISKFTFTAMSAEDYPELPDVEFENAIHIPQAELKRLISGTLFSVSENMARPIHTGCKFEVENESITCVAVDGYRMALRRYFPEESTGRTASFVVPASGLKEVERILSDLEGDASFTLGTKHILFEMDGAAVVCRLLEGEFLDWRRVLPTGNPIKLTGKVSEITNCIERVGLVISEKVKSPVRCVFTQDRVDLTTTSTIGTAHDECYLAGDGQELEIGFNCKYLLEAFKAVPDSETTLELSNNLSPIVLTPCDGTGRYAYMVLPVRMRSGE